MRKLSLLFLLTVLWSFTAPAQTDSLRVVSSIPHPKQWEWGASALPFFGVAAAVAPSLDGAIRGIRTQAIPSFRSHYDDYLQYSPLGVQLSLGMLGVKGRSISRQEILTADACAAASTLLLVDTTKWLTHRLRPDGSSANSFPSGHTATAFMGAELLDIEYGARYPWLSALGCLCYGGRAHP